MIGPSTRTTNSIESTDHAKIPELWETAMTDQDLAAVPTRADDCFYAVLWKYESDETGAYNQVVGVSVNNSEPYQENEKWQVVPIPSEQRKVFDASGQQPESLIATWEKIWELSASGDLPRAFSTDVEVHRGATTEIWISVTG
ncbi:GyrI-like domain-containing protein [uncultured Corynebacterium sp.]|uniref:GyrI-like domain-containing protein n=1 Tax=uncultured Corynebacterium sp. TaxID=159447 RepID=UPI0025DA41CA|nr:effector binding domain-containing protein [uncultured Corynebacterium sp.]